MLNHYRYRFTDRKFSKLVSLCESGVCQMILHHALEAEIPAQVLRLVEEGSKEARELGRGNGRIFFDHEDKSLSFLSKNFDYVAYSHDLISSYYCFQEACGSVAIPPGHDNVEMVTSQYRTGTPPFKHAGDDTGWVDGIALAAIGNWSTSSGRHVHVVAGDEDWEKACRKYGSVTRHKTVSDFLRHVERERPLDYHESDHEAFLDSLAKNESGDRSHLDSHQLRLIEKEDSWRDMRPVHDECRTFGDVLERISIGQLEIFVKSSGAQALFHGPIPKGAKDLILRFPNRLALYDRIRTRDIYKSVARDSHDSWPEEYVFYAAWLKSNPEMFSGRVVPSMGSGISVPDWATFVELITSAMGSKYLGPTSPAARHLSTAYSLHGGADEGGFKLTAASVNVRVKGTGS